MNDRLEICPSNTFLLIDETFGMTPMLDTALEENIKVYFLQLFVTDILHVHERRRYMLG